MTKSSILIDLEDPRTEKIADVISNKTSKKILSILAEKELTETEISSQLKIPMNTVNYNIKKLESTGFIEKTKNYLWSVKGKKIHKYKISNKNIIISPKSIVKGIIPVFIITAALAFLIKIFVGVETSRVSEEKAVADTAGAADTAVATIAEGAAESSRIFLPPSQETLTNVITNGSNSWAWFLLGALIAILIIIFWNSSKKLKGGN